MFLDEDEVKQLTKRIQHQAQAKMLRSLGLTFKIRSDGSLLVLRAHVEKELGGASDGKRIKKEVEPNWDMANA